MILDPGNGALSGGGVSRKLVTAVRLSLCYVAWPHRNIQGDVRGNESLTVTSQRLDCCMNAALFILVRTE